MAIRTTIIVGFPGETDKDFAELEEFIKEVRFDRLGAFLYSKEEGTKSFGFSAQIPEKDKKTRFDRIMKIQKDISIHKSKSCLGRRLRVLVDEKDNSCPNQYIGRTEYDAPDVDGIVWIRSNRALRPGDFVNVRIEDTLEYDLVGVNDESRE